MTSKGRPFIKLLLVSTLLALALIVSVSFMGRASSAYTQVGTNDIQDKLLTPLIDPFNPTYILVNEEALNLSGNPLPGQVTLSLSESYNGGTPQNLGSCTVFTMGNSVADCLLNARFMGWGHYLFLGTVSSNGVALAQTGIDPYIEPEW